MSLYQDSRYPVQANTQDLHARELRAFAASGTWWSAAQRAAIVAEARKARTEAGVQETIAGNDTALDTDLPPAARAVAREVAAGCLSCSPASFARAVADGLRAEEYVETVGIVSRLSNLDVFARGIDVPSRLLPPLDDSSPPTRARPETAADEGAFAPTVPAGQRGGDIGRALYGGDTAPNIMRSLSLVPAEAGALIEVVNAQYLGPDVIMDYTHSPFTALSRPQVELVAAKISALNECFY